MLSFTLGKRLGVERRGHREDVCLTFKKPSAPLQGVCTSLQSHQQLERSGRFTPLAGCGMVSPLDAGHSNKCVGAGRHFQKGHMTNQKVYGRGC